MSPRLSLSIFVTMAGIALGERDAVLRRFRRGDRASAADLRPGLSVAAAIVHVDGFALSLEDAKLELSARTRIPE